MKNCILFDHDGVLVDTEFWYFKAGERALADIGVTLDRDDYLRDMGEGLGMSEITALAKEAIAVAKQYAGDEIVDQVVASVPGLSQFV